VAVEVTADTREVVAMAHGMRDRVVDMRPVWPRVANWLAGQHRQAFRAGGRNLPHPWRPLAQSTVERKRRDNLPADILVRRGQLMRSVTTRRDRRHVERMTPTELVFGTRAPVAALSRHQGRDPVQVPADITPIADMILDHIMGGGR